MSRFLILFFALIPLSVMGQYTYKGKVKDAKTGEPLPFVNIFLKGHTDHGAVTDFNGNYRFTSSILIKEMVASYVGYTEKIKNIKKIKDIYIANFQLKEDVTGLQEVVISAKKENPAFEIMRQVMKRKKTHNLRRLKSYQSENYSKTEISLNSLDSSLLVKKAWFKKLGNVIQSIDSIAGEDGEPIVPIFIDERFSEFYVKPPNVTKEKIIKTTSKGVGFADGTVITQVVGSTFQQYNFYQNWVRVINKQFVSPLTRSWKMYYEYFIKDTVRIDNQECYRIEYWPKKSGDLAFEGQIWITTDSYALKQVDARVSKDANLNFIDRLKITQKLIPTELGAWVPSKNRVLVDFGELGKSIPSIVGSFYTSSDKYIFNQPKEASFYIGDIEFDELAYVDNGEEFWSDKRHEKLNKHELQLISVIDTLNNIPVVKRFARSIDFIINGYWRGDGIVNYGPYPTSLSFNNIETVRLGLGVRTNKNFSSKTQWSGYLGYGFKDKKPKYSTTFEYLHDRRKWTKMGFASKFELNQISFINADSDIDGTLRLNQFNFIRTNNGVIVRPFYTYKQGFFIQTDLLRGFTQRVVLKHKHYLSAFDLYYDFNKDGVIDKINSLTMAEVSLVTRFSIGEAFIQRELSRNSLGSLTGFPITELTYTRGFSGVLGGEYDYNKLDLYMLKRFKLGFFGVSKVVLEGGHIFDDLPYPLLTVHKGNQTFLSSKRVFNMMNNFEFVSDNYVGVRVEHSFEGFVFNRIPLMKKLDLRLVASLNTIYGSLRESNLKSIQESEELIERKNKTGRKTGSFNEFDAGPYVEVAYGIQNIFKFIRVDFFHRLNYLNNLNSSNFGVKIRIQVVL